MKQKQKQKTKVSSSLSNPAAEKGGKRSPADQKRRLALGLILGVAAFFLYSNTLSHGYVLDDFSAIKENNIVRQGVHAIPEIFRTSYRQGYLSVKDGLYRPLSLAMFAVEWNYFPDRPGVSHFINVVLYAFTGFLLFLTLCRLFENRKDKIKQRSGEVIAFITSLLFVAHPLHAEIVANIKSRDEMLSFLFIICSCWFTLEYTDKNKKKFLAYSLCCLFLALLSKETAITWLALLPLALHFFRGLPNRQNLLLLLPFIAVTGIYMIIRSSVLHGFAEPGVSLADNLVAGATTLSTHMGTAFYILGLYVMKLFFPHPLSYDYSFNQIPIVGMSNLFSIFSMLIYLMAGGYAAWILFTSLKEKQGQRPRDEQNIIAFGILFFLITIFLFSNLVLIIGTSMGDRLMYFPSLGFCLVLSVGLKRIAEFIQKEASASAEPLRAAVFLKPGFHPAVILAALFSLKTYSRNFDWKDNYTLYSHDVALVPNSVKAHYYLGLELIKTVAEQEPDQMKKKTIYENGISELEKSAEILPSFSSAYVQMGVAYFHLKNYEKAIEKYAKADALKPSDAITLNNIGSVYFEWGKYDQARVKFEQALAVDPRFVDAHMNLGSVLGTVKDFNGALASFQNAIRYAPDNARGYFFMAVTYQNMGDKTNADAYFQRAQQLDPNLKKP